jgi:protoporphyrinogen oxidase
MSKIIIVGSGLSALVIAKTVKKYVNKNAEIHIIEREKSAGGQFSSINYGKDGYFDFGMHVYYDSCIPEIDDMVFSLLPREEWNVMENNEKDIAGLYVNGQLQTETPYIDLRNFPEEKRKEYIGSLLLNIARDKSNDPKKTAYDILTTHFGKLITDEVFVPVFEKLYGNHLSDLDEMILSLTTVNRLAMFDEQLMVDLMKSDEIRARLCHPNQFTLPAYRTNGQRALYPKKYGMYRVQEKFKADLEKEGVKFYLSTQITELVQENNSVSQIKVKTPEGELSFTDIEKIYWSAGIVPLAMSLNIDVADLKYDSRPPASFVNLLFNKPLSMGKLYYFYCFDKNFRSFRVTNYFNYCKDALSERGCPACVEFWPDANDTSLTPEQIVEITLKELKTFGVIDDTYELKFSKVERGGGFPLPSLKNIDNLSTVRERIKYKKIQNLVPVGVLAEKNVFFIKDVLTDAYNKVLNKK